MRNNTALLVGIGLVVTSALLWIVGRNGGIEGGKQGVSKISASLDMLEPNTRVAAVELLGRLRAAGIDHAVVSTRRTCDEQTALYARGVTKVAGCNSWHVHGRAVDIMALYPDGTWVKNGNDPVYERMGVLGRSVGFKWGGDFSDPCHFEYHPGLKISDVCLADTCESMRESSSEVLGYDQQPLIWE